VSFPRSTRWRRSVSGMGRRIQGDGYRDVDLSRKVHDTRGLQSLREPLQPFAVSSPQGRQPRSQGEDP